MPKEITRQPADLRRLFMKRRNTGVKWTGEEITRLKSHSRHLSLYVPALIIFVPYSCRDPRQTREKSNVIVDVIFSVIMILISRSGVACGNVGHGETRNPLHTQLRVHELVTLHLKLRTSYSHPNLK
jgi:hypothetical protein